MNAANMETETPTGTATYCPEDNKLRLYIGRVPRPEYERLRAQGWKALHKQREAGGGDFVATWTPERRNTALAYAGIIEDEDMGPAERAADRAERFAGYREKRAGEATGHADRYDAGPAAHGFQSQARAEKAAARHDRIADRAGDAWDKAEYWQRRTAGVISHALHVSSPSVRMGRIKELEADIRRMEQSPDSYPNWLTHYRLRLAYEYQMIEAQGGRAGVLEIEVGGTFRGHVITKVNRSNASGRVISVQILRPKIHGDTWRTKTNVPGTEYSLGQLDTEHAPPEDYQPPTDASRAKLAAFEEAKKAAAKVRKATAPACPLVNPTDADAERLIARWNENRRADFLRQHGASAKHYEFKPCEIRRMPQAFYSAHSTGSYAKAETRSLCSLGRLEERNSFCDYSGQAERAAARGPALCQIRTTGFDPVHVILLTDKPQKPLPAAVWEAHKAGAVAEAVPA